MHIKTKKINSLSYLDQLNGQQRSAVETLKGPVMIIAGAGSGKTRVITYRVAHLLHNKVEPFNILCLTFTNKSAKEMRERIELIAGPIAKNLWMGTYHSTFAKILRFEADKLNYPTNFTIYDSDDSKSLLKAILKEQGLDSTAYSPNFVATRISLAKNNLISVKKYLESPEIQSDDQSTGRPKIGEIYKIYQTRLARSGAMDFDDLLFNTFRLLNNFPEVLYKYQNKFKYIMVDEFQDTNYCQYLIVKKLAAVHENLCVVGDDAQSIYAFRGASIQNILNFEKDYSDLSIFKLEQNYRSTQTIVNAANSIIKNNEDQLRKDVFSDNAVGDKIKVLSCFTDSEEGKKVAESIMEEVARKGTSYQSFCILYRTNSQSRSIEEALRRLNIPYKIYGGLSFYQRKEIKDLIGYFRLAINPNDEQAMKRTINYPKRGIGKTSVEQIIIAADEHKVTQWEVISDPIKYLKAKGASKKIEDFSTMIKSFAVKVSTENAFEAADFIAKSSGVHKDLYNDKTVEGLARYENIQELLNGVKQYSVREGLEDESLAGFLQEVSLLGALDVSDEELGEHVSLMTIHSSKGLEFDQVYLVGIEENLFPSQMSIGSREDLEEERRLFYVALTRARHKVSLSHANQRFRFGNLISSEPSRFIKEIDEQYLDLVKPKRLDSLGGNDNDFSRGSNWSKKESSGGFSTRTVLKPKPKAKPIYIHKPTKEFEAQTVTKISMGNNIEHIKFGFGKVTQVEGDFPNQKVTVNFKELGEKQILIKFAKLRIIE
ncbi:MAG: DNA helicase-2/ATP-dependent DNA helicase PcrA [Sphingobacteriales bacterium]